MSDKAKGKKDKKADKKKEENKENVEAKKEEGGEEGEVKIDHLGPKDLPAGEELFGVCHICATFNDTFIHVTDLSGRETYARVTGGMKVKADREESLHHQIFLQRVILYKLFQPLKHQF